MPSIESVTFVSAVAKVQTLADSGIRVTLDLPEDAIVEAAWLMKAKQTSVALTVTCKPVEDDRTAEKSRKIHI
jgi:hypothetical protein